MFDFDSLREILSTISKNKFRTFLTGLAVAWGIYMLIFLIGAGNGLKNGVQSNFSNRAKNAVSLWPGRTSMPYGGLPADRRIIFDERDYDLLRNRISNVEYLSPKIRQGGTISYGDEYGSWSLEGITPDAAYISNLEVNNNDGRFLNVMDLKERRKVIVINEEMKKVLFNNEDPIGKYVISGKLAFRVIGVYTEAVARNNAPAYIPFTTAQTLYNKGRGFHQIDFTVTGLRTVEDNQAYIDYLRERMGKLHTFNPKDRAALNIWNTAEQSIESEKVFNGIDLVVLAIGVLSLLGGIVGVANIMLVTVKERTREIGIRKALGANPSSILRLIIFEAILITGISGYIGMLMGIGTTELISSVLSGASSDGPAVFKDPTVNLDVVIGSTLFLIVAGIIAGLIPAIKATRVSPIEAMRAE